MKKTHVFFGANAHLVRGLPEIDPYQSLTEMLEEANNLGWMGQLLIMRSCFNILKSIDLETPTATRLPTPMSHWICFVFSQKCFTRGYNC